MLEAALVLPILVIVAFGTIEFGYALYVKHSLQSASREGARAGIPPGSSNADVTAAIDRALRTGGLSRVPVQRAVRRPDGTAVNVSGLTSGQAFEVEVSVEWRHFSILGSDFLGGTLSSRTTMRREG